MRSIPYAIFVCSPNSASAVQPRKCSDEDAPVRLPGHAIPQVHHAEDDSRNTTPDVTRVVQDAAEKLLLDAMPSRSRPETLAAKTENAALLAAMLSIPRPSCFARADVTTPA